MYGLCVCGGGGYWDFVDTSASQTCELEARERGWGVVLGEIQRQIRIPERDYESLARYQQAHTQPTVPDSGSLFIDYILTGLWLVEPVSGLVFSITNGAVVIFKFRQTQKLD